LIKLLPCILFEKYIYILALEMVSAGNQHCANCIGAVSFRAAEMTVSDALSKYRLLYCSVRHRNTEHTGAYVPVD